eukprot:TRINITY_DN9062_c0_g1_i1.p1 TRINITY_DN9062_c0_g1~~TRINITY_DN9062_c0_g1_i1.p1  ORF type:complete len:167 (+),score=29.53 TRINITY_DN9062_c0_g1_i1:63-503(+)
MSLAGKEYCLQLARSPERSHEWRSFLAEIQVDPLHVRLVSGLVQLLSEDVERSPTRRVFSCELVVQFVVHLALGLTLIIGIVLYWVGGPESWLRVSGNILLQVHNGLTLLLLCSSGVVSRVTESIIKNLLYWQHTKAKVKDKLKIF